MQAFLPLNSPSHPITAGKIGAGNLFPGFSEISWINTTTGFPRVPPPGRSTGAVSSRIVEMFIFLRLQFQGWNESCRKEL
jgi:hypothetical protein